MTIAPQQLAPAACNGEVTVATEDGPEVSACTGCTGCSSYRRRVARTGDVFLGAAVIDPEEF